MVLTMFVDMAVVNPTPFVGYAAALKASGEKQPVHLIQVCQIMGAIATINEARLLNSFKIYDIQLLIVEILNWKRIFVILACAFTVINISDGVKDPPCNV